MVERVDAGAPLLRLESITKSFGPVQALRGVSLDIRAGEVLALIGENGAGKSTLMKVLSGAHRPDSGTIEMDGRALSLDGPADARSAGIAMIYQELALAPHLSVEENVTLGLERSRFGGFLRSQSERVSAALGLLGAGEIAPDVKVQSLPVARQQLVEIARAIVSDARVVIMDEPTSSLSEDDRRALFRVIRNLRGEGLAVVYISHFLDEVGEIADRFAVLRDGETAGSGVVQDTDTASLVQMMIGRPLRDMYPAPDPAVGDVVLDVEGARGSPLPKGVSLRLRRGEILGVFGLVGAGRTELFRCLFGLGAGSGGTVRVGRERAFALTAMRPSAALGAGLDHLSENRKDEGLAQGRSITENITLSAIAKRSRYGFLDLAAERGSAGRLVEKLRVRCSDVGQPVSALSGGNQQKVALARLVHHDSDIFLLDEPTRGIDIGSKHEIFELVHQLASRGKSVVVVSSYLPELLATCHTLGVMHRGELGGVRPVSEWSEDEIMHFATTGKPGAQEQSAP